MAFVDLNPIHHYQPPHAISGPIKGRSAASKRGASTISHKHNNFVAPAPKITASADFKHFDLIECVDLTISSAIEAIGDLLGEPVLAFEETKRYVHGKVHCPRCRWDIH